MDKPTSFDAGAPDPLLLPHTDFTRRHRKVIWRKATLPMVPSFEPNVVTTLTEWLVKKW